MTTERVRVDLSGAPQTMLATLYAKALDADFNEPILGDRFAKQIGAGFRRGQHVPISPLSLRNDVNSPTTGILRATRC